MLAKARSLYNAPLALATILPIMKFEKRQMASASTQLNSIAIEWFVDKRGIDMNVQTVDEYCIGKARTGGFNLELTVGQLLTSDI